MPRRQTHIDSARRRSAASATAQSPSMVLLVLLGTIGIVAYAAFLLNPANRGDLIPYALVIVAESVLLFGALMSMWTSLTGSVDVRDAQYHAARDGLFSTRQVVAGGLGDDPRRWPFRIAGETKRVAVFITTYGEDLEVIRRTVLAAVAMYGRHDTVVLDDGHSDDVARIADKAGAGYLRREHRVHAKAGNVNHALSQIACDFFAIFDADFVPDPAFLVETMPFFARNSVAFVQTPQTYGNLRGFIARGAGYMQTVFYTLVQPGRNRFNAAFCVGTNVVFRRTAIEDVGGVYTGSKSEDVWTSLNLHERGWRSVFLPKTLAVGDAPETIAAYAKQQLRWATGGFEILLTHNPLSRKRRLTLDQRLQYFVTSTHYLTGIVPALLMLVPPLEIYFDLRPMELTVGPGQWLLFYAGFYALQVMLAFYAVGSFRPEVLLLSAVSWPIYLKALTNVLRGTQTAWVATGAKKGGYDSPFNYVVPQMLAFLFLLLTSAVGVLRDTGNQVFTLATAWNATNTLIVLVFLVTAAREARTLRRAAKGLPSRRTVAPAESPLPVHDLPFPPTGALRPIRTVPSSSSPPLDATVPVHIPVPMSMPVSGPRRDEEVTA